MTTKLTDRQQQILDLIRQTIARTGFPPTRAEIAGALGFRSPNAAEDHLKALARKGAIKLTAGASRGIRLKDVVSSIPESPPAAFARMLLPLIGRVAVGSPILAEEHIEREVGVDPELFSQTPDYLLKVRTADIQSFRRTLGESITQLPHVANSSSFVAMEAVKDTVS